MGSWARGRQFASTWPGSISVSQLDLWKLCFHTATSLEWQHFLLPWHLLSEHKQKRLVLCYEKTHEDCLWIALGEKTRWGSENFSSPPAPHTHAWVWGKAKFCVASQRRFPGHSRNTEIKLVHMEPLPKLIQDFLFWKRPSFHLKHLLLHFILKLSQRQLKPSLCCVCELFFFHKRSFYLRQLLQLLEVNSFQDTSDHIAFCRFFKEQLRYLKNLSSR